MRFECGPEWDRRVINIEPKGRIGVLMSGGADSYILYQLLRKIPDCPHIHIFWIETGGTTGPGWDLVETVQKLTRRYDIHEITEFLHHTINDTPDYLPFDQVVIKTNDWIVEKYSLDILYNGTNMNPPTEFFPEFPFAYEQHWSIPEYTKVKAPFLHLYKYHILDLGKQYNIDISEAHSCNTFPTAEGHCGECRSCREKVWGYEQLK